MKMFRYTQKLFKRLYCTASKQITERLSHRSLIEVSGPDATPLLQGLITNDLTDLSLLKSGCVYGMFLNNKGRILYDTIVYKTDQSNGYLVEVDKSVAVAVCKHLVIYKLRKDVTVRNVDDSYELWVRFDPSDVPNYGTVPIKAKHTEIEFDEKEIARMYSFGDPRLPVLGQRLINCVHKSNEFFNNVKAVAYRHLRYRIGIAEGVDELPPGNCFPLEANCDYLNGVSFDKGCYLGQELTARSHHTGVIRKRYMPFFITSDLSEASITFDDPVKTESKSVGKVRGYDTCSGLGIGLLRIENVLNNKIFINRTNVQTLVPFWWPQKGVKSDPEVVPDEIDVNIINMNQKSDETPKTGEVLVKGSLKRKENS